jgi:hypothetical protein
LYRQAAELEERALAKIPADKVRTRGIVGISATALWFKSGRRDQAERVARALLDDESLPVFARSEVQELLDDIQRTGAESLPGARMFDVQVTFSQHYRVAAPTRGAAEELAMRQWARGEQAEGSELVAVTTVEAQKSGTR